MNRSLKFMQMSDLHLGVSLSGGRLKLPYEKVQTREREMREAVKVAIELAQSEAVDVILIPGDLWEQDSVNLEDIRFLLDHFSRTNIPIIIAPGNHDYYYPSSHYNNNLVFSLCQKPWSPNVYIFNEYDFQHIRVPELPNVVFSGLAYRSNNEVHSRLLRARVEVPEGDLHIGLIHGSRDDNLPPGKMFTLPFSVSELLAQPFDWTALGHYHRYSEIQDDQGRIRAAYSGAAVAFSLNETDVGGALIGVVQPGGVQPDQLKRIPLDRRKIFHLTIDITGCTHISAIEEHIAETLTVNGVSENDIALVELTGTYPMGNRIYLSDDFVGSICWFLRVETDKVVPEWSLETISNVNPRTTEGLFIARIKKMMDEATLRGDENERQRLQRALQYGLDALHGRNITIR